LHRADIIALRRDSRAPGAARPDPHAAERERISRASSRHRKTLAAYRDDPDGDDEREHRGVDRRMNLEKRAGCGANGQCDKHMAQSAVLFAG
jgi:hypothetical protein